MKSIFKKIAFVLALAMVVTMLPAKSVDAAASGPQLKKHRVLYLNEGGDVTGTYLNKAYATVWNFKEDGYTVKFESKNPEIATVGAKKGMVTAVSVGVTEVIATFSKEGAADVVKTCKVEVKKNAAVVTVDEDSQSKLGELKAGEKFTAVAVKTDADGSNEDITDGVRFAVADEKIATVNAKTGEITAVAVGETELTVWGVQWEYSMTEKKYVLTKTTPETPYKLVVKSAFRAEQTAYNAFQIFFDTEEVAKAAVDETSKYLTSASAAVTEKEDIVKVYEVVKNTKGEVVADGAVVVIGEISQKDDEKDVAVAKMFQELKQNTEYVVYYKNSKATFTTTENVAAGITIRPGTSTKTNVDGVGSTTEISLGIYAYGENGQEVNLDGCVDYDGWRVNVTLEEVGGEQYHPDYSVSTNPLDAYVDFYTDDAKVSVTVRATLLDYFNEKEPGKPLVDQTTIRMGDYTSLNAKIAAYGVHSVDSTHTTDGVYGKAEFAAEDIGRRLFVKLEIYRNGKTEEHFSDVEVGTFTFRSANEDKLIVGEYSGELFPAKEPTNDTVNVFVYYDGQLVGFCPIKVWEKRVLTKLIVEPSASQMSYNPSTGINDEITLTVKPVDQLGDPFIDVSVTCSVIGGADAYVSASETKNSDGSYTMTLGNNVFATKFTATGNLPKTQRSIRIVCTAVYDDGLTKRTLTASTAFSAKNTDGASLSRYKLELPTTLDMKLADADGGRVSDKTVKIAVYAMDREGFKIEKLDIAPPYNDESVKAAKYCITIQKNNKYINDSDYFTSNGSKELNFKTVVPTNAYVVSRSAIEGEVIPSNVKEQFVTVSGAAISQKMNVLEKAETGSYQVSLYVDGKRVTGAVLQIKDTQSEVINRLWKKNRVDGYAGTIGGVLTAIENAFDFKLGDTKINSSIYVGEVELVDKVPSNKIIINDDIVVHGNSVAVRQVRYLLTHTENGITYEYELVIPVNKTILVGVTQ